MVWTRFGHRVSSAKALGLVILLGQSALAADVGGKFAIEGAGLQTCEAFVTAWGAGSSDIALYGGWIDGYLTGLNQFLPETYDLAPWQITQTLLGMTKSVCDQSDSDKRFIDAFFDVVRLLQPGALKRESGAIGLTHDGRSTVMYADIIVLLKARLIELGKLEATADSTFDSTTAEALKAFQSERGLVESGLPDQQTLFELLMKRP
jgi:hypothetical protein